ncbi:MAG: 3-keto-disaccharide hydrolase [Opitutales bacterium]
MKKLLTIPLACLSLGLSFVFGAEVPPIMGDWSGGHINPPKNSYGAKNPTLVGRVIGHKDGLFEVQMMNAFERRAHYDFRQILKPENGVIKYEDKGWTFELKEGSWTGVRRGKAKGGKIIDMPFELKKITRVSSTMGRPAPEGADILLPVNNLDAWEHDSGKPATWNLLEGGVMENFPRKMGNKAGGDVRTKAKYADCEVHIEFKLPYEPANLGQNRGNSGIFIQSLYEVQILDSYGFDADWTECGALYRVSPAKVNRCRPPEEWQTYDITFRAARYDENGKLIKHPVMTVLHNGELIHNEQEIFELPQYLEVRRTQKHMKEPMPIILQDHGHKVQFRNFWVKPL